MKILGIDDNEDLLDLCELALTSDGHEYTAINNGREGLQEIKDKKFDIVFLDLSMPDFSGEDVIDALVNVRPISKGSRVQRPGHGRYRRTTPFRCSPKAGAGEKRSF